MFVQAADFCRVQRVEPGSGRQLDDARADRISHHGAGQAGASGVIYPHHIPLGDAADGRIVGVEPHRFTIVDFRATAHLAAVELAVEP